MIRIQQTITVNASPEVCFDLARSVDDHVESMAANDERIIGGKMTGLLELGDRLTFESRQLGLRFTLTAEISDYDRPASFTDRQVSGPFKKLTHTHLFESIQGGARMTDKIDVTAKLGPLGWLAERLVIKPLLASTLVRRQAHIKFKAESDRLD
jgi:ligand-binding SRPBCC domain-containing protein